MHTGWPAPALSLLIQGQAAPVCRLLKHLLQLQQWVAPLSFSRPVPRFTYATATAVFCAQKPSTDVST